VTRTTEFDQLMTGVAAGSEGAVWQLAETYTPYIIRAVRASLPKSVRIKIDSQDFAQILWASLLLGNFDLTRLTTPQQLIGYIAAAAKNKVNLATRHYLRTQKRDVTRERSIEDVAQGIRNPRGEARNRDCGVASREPTPSALASVRERWNRILAGATDRDRQILQLRLQRFTFEAIGKELKINRVTARRAVQRLIEQLSE
jgi:RNA polymerase sigma factor (sigma-70 family)